MKQFAMKGMLVLAIGVALAMFFAGTVRTIVTPKVKIVSAKSGRLEQSIALKGKLTFPSTEELNVDAARGQTTNVKKVNVRAGYEIKKGDVLAELEMMNFDEDYDKLRLEYNEKIKKLADLDVKNKGLPRTNQRNTAYDTLIERRMEMIDQKVRCLALVKQEGVMVPDGMKSAEVEAFVRENGGSPALILAAAAYAEAQAAVNRAQNNLDGLMSDKKTKGKEGVYDYLKERATAQQEITEAEKKMTELRLKKSKLEQVIAPHDGYVTNVAIKPGDTYEGKTAFTVSKEATVPVLRADVSEIRQSIEVSATVVIKSDYREATTKVIAGGIDLEGKRYVDVEITEELSEMMGGISRMMLGDTDMTVTYRAKESATLLPASAVRSEGENQDYVWVIRQKYGGFTGEHMELEKTDVTVLQRGGKVVSIAEDLMGTRIADMEDRAIKDGDTVMEYVN